MNRRLCFKAAALGAITHALSMPTLAQERYPSKPIRMVVQFPPGSTPDTLARVSAAHLQERFGQPVVVDNRPGAGGNIAAEAVFASPADGYTLLLGQNGLAWAPWLFPKLAFDPMALAPVSILADVPFVLGVKKDLPVNSAKELVAYAKSRPGQLTCGTSGIGSPQHLVAELFMARTGTKFVVVPYKGAAAILPDVIEGRLDLVFSAADGQLPHIQANKLRGLAVVGERRLAALPQMPTLSESGLGIEATKFWIGLFAPPGTPVAVTQRLAEELRVIRDNKTMVQRIQAAGTELVLSTPEEEAMAMKSDNERWGAVIKSAKITLE